MAAVYTITGLHCASCVAKVRAALEGMAGRIDVSLEPPEVRLFEPKISDLQVLRAAVAKVGPYDIKPHASAVPARATGSTTPAQSSNQPAHRLMTYLPLLIIAGYIAVASFAGTSTPAGPDWQLWMTHFMAGFFLVFSAFKFLDLAGFANAYATYDLLAKRWHGYGYVYPFLELGLGLAYVFRWSLTTTHIATIVLMGFSSLGVIAALRENRTIQCACLGTVLKLPMSTITLVEDLGMVAMAALALIGGGLA